MMINNIDVYLREKGVKPSYQRKRIFEYMMNNHTHPSVNDIYEALIGEIPTLSKATVYNTMNLFLEHQLIEVLPIDTNEVRFDIYNPKEHGHFKCDVCGEIFDVNIKINVEDLSDDLLGFQVDAEIYNFRGTCRLCREKAKEAELLSTSNAV
ncbi:transcriptional repressor [Proteiniclasticum sp. BAD-10]|uniref:Transcriptional repressor n=1 Tax=Proteiniclasticum sediminis TaxID=2804028 RepID=A0A941CNH3_9CLOT|nr:Fur family transcriptional regulator [Proteiniclasticum sediminis]MBR0575835.1 transcriptional repressor [Proteiniclasticum sediminis]